MRPNGCANAMADVTLSEQAGWHGRRTGRRIGCAEKRAGRRVSGHAGQGRWPRGKRTVDSHEGKRRDGRGWIRMLRTGTLYCINTIPAGSNILVQSVQR